MIDPLTEHVVSLTQATKDIPVRRRGKKPHVSCLYRWTKTGCKGVILESIQIGGTRCTSREALARFFRRLTDGNDSTPQERRSPARQRRAVEAAERELMREGL